MLHTSQRLIRRRIGRGEHRGLAPELVAPQPRSDPTGRGAVWRLRASQGDERRASWGRASTPRRCPQLRARSQSHRRRYHCQCRTLSPSCVRWCLLQGWYWAPHPLPRLGLMHHRTHQSLSSAVRGAQKCRSANTDYPRFAPCCFQFRGKEQVKREGKKGGGGGSEQLRAAKRCERAGEWQGCGQRGMASRKIKQCAAPEHSG